MLMKILKHHKKNKKTSPFAPIVLEAEISKVDITKKSETKTSAERGEKCFCVCVT